MSLSCLKTENLSLYTVICEKIAGRLGAGYTFNRCRSRACSAVGSHGTAVAESCMRYQQILLQGPQDDLVLACSVALQRAGAARDTCQGKLLHLTSPAGLQGMG
jgi:hypothetical protein